ncbi:F-box/FBD/LRR-repeat protein At1g13570-like [Lycium ferocissimum]|uniref:F-box/FBD/LRR-repeat protein At1g13570-like n=1 Tax=Lycium ferocissimum TaxID=112874 RepID=UPI0028166F9E|nr:F-box/FBD/LRR-repeat protein At1g13570-like [Lycium ferocissimum]
MRTEFALNEWDEESPEVKFTNIINQLLTHHEGPITKFTLDIHSLEISCPKIDDFIYFLTMNDIQHLVLRFPSNKPYKITFSLFTCLQLRHLTLHDCFLHPPSFFKEFDMLISLELCKVTISSELLESLISKCPLLEQLVLKNTEILATIEINAPMLRSFDFKGSISSICLKNVPCLAKASLICDDSFMVADYYFGFAEFFESCSALEHLHMTCEFSVVVVVSLLHCYAIGLLLG